MKTPPAPAPVLSIIGKRDLELGPFAIDEPLQETSPWANWRLRPDEDGIAWLLLDKKGSGANTLSEDVLAELNAVLDKVERDRPRGLVIRSAKRSGFIAGADIAQFRNVTDVTQIESMIAKGHAVLDRLDRLPFPTVAVIHGYCLGGGLEVALACDFRIAVDDASFGFPEVQLGLHPGLGGTVRLTRLISPVEAMTMILARELRGRNITVNAVAPGPTATELFLDGKPQAAIDHLTKLSPLERLGRPDDIAAAVSFLAGPDGSWINGQTLRPNGGII